MLTSQKNSFPRKPQNHEIQDTSSELLIFLRQKKPWEESRYYVFARGWPGIGEYIGDEESLVSFPFSLVDSMRKRVVGYRRLSTRTLVSWLERRDRDRGLDRTTGWMGWDGKKATDRRTDGRAGGDGCAGCAMELGFYQARCPTSYGPVRRVHTYVSMAIAPMGQLVFRIRCTGRGTTKKRITLANCRRGAAAI